MAYKFDWDRIRGGAGAGAGIGLLLSIASCVVITTFGRGERNAANGMAAGCGVFLLCLFCGPPLAFFGGMMLDNKRDRAAEEEGNKRRRAAEEEARIERERKVREEQRSFRQALQTLPKAAVTLFEGLPDKLSGAEGWLDQATRDLSEGAYAPFWQSIENASHWLGTYNDDTQQISQLALQYATVRRRYLGNSAGFPISKESARGVAAVGGTAERLNQLVRQAQRSFEFSMIYEQRKTNQLLVAGFTTLASALDGMGRRLASSIDELSASVDRSFIALQTNVEGLAQEIRASSEGVGEAVRESGRELAQRHDRALEMLDNIQRRRIPLPREFRDGAY